MQPTGTGIPWSELQDFHVLAQTQRLADAAARLGVDATTVSRRVQRLERRLGNTLFEHTRAGHVLTDAGQALLVRVEAMQRSADQIEDSPSGGRLTGTIRVSVSEGLGTEMVAEALIDFHRLHPDVVIELVANSGFLNPSRREADIAVLLERPRTGPVVVRKISDYRLRLYAAATHPAARRADMTAAALLEYPLVGYIPDLIYAPELNYLDELIPGLAPAIRSSSINAQHRMIGSGIGIGVLPRFIGDADPGLVPILQTLQITRSFWIVTHRDTRQLRRVRVFHDWLCDFIAGARGRLIGIDRG